MPAAAAAAPLPVPPRRRLLLVRLGVERGRDVDGWRRRAQGLLWTAPCRRAPPQRNPAQPLTHSQPPLFSSRPLSSFHLLVIMTRSCTARASTTRRCEVRWPDGLEAALLSSSRSAAAALSAPRQGRSLHAPLPFRNPHQKTTRHNVTQTQQYKTDAIRAVQEQDGHEVTVRVTWQPGDVERFVAEAALLGDATRYGAVCVCWWWGAGGDSWPEWLGGAWGAEDLRVPSSLKSQGRGDQLRGQRQRTPPDSPPCPPPTTPALLPQQNKTRSSPAAATAR